MADPITVALIEPDPEWVIVEADGTTRDDYDLTFTGEQWQRFRVGRNCLRCFEQQEIAYMLATSEQCRRTPERHLPGCAYADRPTDTDRPGDCQWTGDGIRTRQQRDVAREFQGPKWVGPRLSLAETLDEDDEKRAKYKQDSGRPAGPWVPPWVRL